MFKNYENQAGYPVAEGGWKIGGVTLLVSRVHSDSGMTVESSQANVLLNNSTTYSMSPSGYAVYLWGGNMTFMECYFSGSGPCDIYVPADCMENSFQVFGGHNENINGVFFVKDRADGEVTAPLYAIHNFDGLSISMKGAGRLILDGCGVPYVDLGDNSNTSDQALQILDIRNSRIAYKVGQKANAASAQKVIFSAENTLFYGGSSITTPFNQYFESHRVNKIVNCMFSGSSFTDSIKRLNYQGVGMFSDESNGDSQFSFGANASNTNVLYGSQTGIDILKGAYRKDGALFAAGPDGSMIRQGENFLSFKTFTGDTADTAVDSWDERFAAELNGDIWVTKANGHRVGWSDSTPSSGTWSQGDIIYNTNVSASGTYAWIYTGSSWRTLQ